MIVVIEEDNRKFSIDLGAEALITAEKENLRIAVEIKTFSGSIMNQFHMALGQYLDYRAALNESEDERDRLLYIAVSHLIYSELIDIKFISRRIQEYGLRFVTIDLENENVVEWIG